MQIRIEGRCESCELLKSILEQERHNNKKLIEQICEMNKPQIVIREDVPNELPKAIGGVIPWRVKREMAEAESRAAAELLKKKQNEMIANLENELEIKDDNSTE